MDLTLLEGSLTVQDSPGLDTFDPRLADIIGLIEVANYIEAAAQSELLLKEEIYDIRIICYFLYGEFLENGPDSINKSFNCLVNVIDENWDAIGPARKREKGIANSLKWLFTQLIKKIEYEEKKNDGIWASWLDSDSELIGQGIEGCAKLQKVFSRSLEDLAGPVNEIINKLKSWLDQFYQVVYKEPVAEKVVEHLVDDKSGSVSVPEAQATVSTPASQPGSYHMSQLSLKLMTFQQLVKMKKFNLAAVVSDNINELISDFNPRKHLPELFSPYMQTYATHVNELSQKSSLNDSLEWQALKELYRIDLEAFMNFNENILFETQGKAIFFRNAPKAKSYSEVSQTQDSVDTISQDSSTKTDEWGDESTDDGWGDESTDDGWGDESTDDGWN